MSGWQPVTLHITSAWHLYPGYHGNAVAMRSIYLEISQLQMSLGAALSNKAWSNYRQGSSLFPILTLTDRKDFNKERERH